jgi:hypothetical protein
MSRGSTSRVPLASIGCTPSGGLLSLYNCYKHSLPVGIIEPKFTKYLLPLPQGTARTYSSFRQLQALNFCNMQMILHKQMSQFTYGDESNKCGQLTSERSDLTLKRHNRRSSLLGSSRAARGVRGGASPSSNNRSSKQ